MPVKHRKQTKRPAASKGVRAAQRGSRKAPVPRVERARKHTASSAAHSARKEAGPSKATSKSTSSVSQGRMLRARLQAWLDSLPAELREQVAKFSDQQKRRLIAYVAAGVLGTGALGTAATVAHTLTRPTGALQKCKQAFDALKSSGDAVNELRLAQQACDPSKTTERLSFVQRRLLQAAYDRVVDPYGFIPTKVLPDPATYPERSIKECAQAVRAMSNESYDLGMRTRQLETVSSACNIGLLDGRRLNLTEYELKQLEEMYEKWYLKRWQHVDPTVDDVFGKFLQELPDAIKAYPDMWHKGVRRAARLAEITRLFGQNWRDKLDRWLQSTAQPANSTVSNTGVVDGPRRSSPGSGPPPSQPPGVPPQGPGQRPRPSDAGLQAGLPGLQAGLPAAPAPAVAQSSPQARPVVQLNKFRRAVKQKAKYTPRQLRELKRDAVKEQEGNRVALDEIENLALEAGLR